MLCCDKLSTKFFCLYTFTSDKIHLERMSNSQKKIVYLHIVLE